jgi:hypothetical protein
MAGSFHQNKNIEISGAGSGPVPVGHFLASAAGNALQRGGATIANLTANWASIAGPSLAAFTVPSKLTKGPSDPADSGTHAPAVLHLKVDPVRALEVQYSVPQLIERINQSVGYKAVAQLRLIQAPLAARPKLKPASVPAMPAPPVPSANSRLGGALARMASGIKARQA